MNDLEYFKFLQSSDGEEICKGKKNEQFKYMKQEEFIYRNINYSGLYAVVLVNCEAVLKYQVAIETLNPFGHLTGEYIFLVPFYAVLSAVYLIFLICWSACLCNYYSYSISIQRFCVPFILTSAMIEHSLNFWYWEYINLTGKKSWIMMVLSIAGKGVRDAFGRSLLLAASCGWGIVDDNPPFGNYIIYICGALYFVFDILYEAISKIYLKNELWLLLVSTLPLILTNSLIFYFVFAWFAQTFVRLTKMKQSYKLGLLKRFAFVLVIGAILSILWTVVEVMTKCFLDVEEYWKGVWLYVGIWDVIFAVMVVSFMVIWRIDEKSKDLANAYQIRADEELSIEKEDNFGIELSRFSK